MSCSLSSIVIFEMFHHSIRNQRRNFSLDFASLDHLCPWEISINKALNYLSFKSQGISLRHCLNYRDYHRVLYTHTYSHMHVHIYLSTCAILCADKHRGGSGGYCCLITIGRPFFSFSAGYQTQVKDVHSNMAVSIVFRCSEILRIREINADPSYV
jgi:hypothetical protein